MRLPCIQSGVERVARDKGTLIDLTTTGGERSPPVLSHDPDREHTLVAEDQALQWSGFYGYDWKER